jgi:hypothetical protein
MHRIKRKVLPHPGPARSREQLSSDHETCWINKLATVWLKYNSGMNNSPNNPRHIKLDVKYMADVTISELPDHLPRLQIPHLYGSVITGTDETSVCVIERQGAHEKIMTDESPNTLARGSRPDFYFTVIRT